MNSPTPTPAPGKGFLITSAVLQSVGLLYLILTSMVAAEVSMALSIALMVLSACAAAGTVFLFLRRRWAWYLSTTVAALLTIAGLVLTPTLLWLGLIYAVAGACILGLLWAGRAALHGGWPPDEAASGSSR
jgi:hypothetical protein